MGHRKRRAISARLAARAGTPGTAASERRLPTFASTAQQAGRATLRVEVPAAIIAQRGSSLKIWGQNPATLVRLDGTRKTITSLSACHAYKVVTVRMMAPQYARSVQLAFSRTCQNRRSASKR